MVEDEHSSSTIHNLFAPIPNPQCSHAVEDLETSRVLLIATILINLVSPPPVTMSQYGANVNHNEVDDDDWDFGPYFHRRFYPRSVPLSAWIENSRLIASDPHAVRFIFLCASAEHSGLKSLGLQLLSTIRYPLDPPKCPLPIENPPLGWTPLMENGCRLGQLTLAFITRCLLESEDRTELIAGMV